MLAWLVAVVALVASATELVGPKHEAAAATLPAGFQQSTVVRGLVMPIGFEFAPDGRIFVAERSGLVKVFDNLSDTTPTIFADLRTNVFSGNSRGLIGLALDPDWANSKYVYVLYNLDAPIGGTPPVYGTPGATDDNCPATGSAVECLVGARLSRLPAATNTAGPEQVLIEDWCQPFSSHAIGDLAFGADGALYASSGDGAWAGQPDYGQRGAFPNICGDPGAPKGVATTSPTGEGGALRAQDLQTPGDPASPDGAIIRVNKNTGAGLPDNPLAASADPMARRIISYGHRNPWRLKFRPGTSELWVADVGWNTWEEINRIPDTTPAQPYNHGWPCYEGPDKAYNIGLNLCKPLFANPSMVSFPYFTYKQNAGVYPGDTCNNTSSAVSAMAFYPGGAYPASYDGALFFSDYARQCLFLMPLGAGGQPDKTKVSTFMAGVRVVDMEVGPNGDLFLLDMFGPQGGTITRITYPAGELIPTAAMTATPTDGPAPLAVSFSAAGSTKVNPGDTLSYGWDFDGNGSFTDATTVAPTFTYTTPGLYTARVRVTDQLNRSDIASVEISVGTPPVPTITSPLTSATWKVGDTITFAGSATLNSTPMAASALSWQVILHHCDTVTQCHTHPVGGYSGVAGGSFQAPDHEYPAFLELQLTATAPSGVAGTTSVTLSPQTVDVTLASSPPGLKATISGNTGTTPFTRTEIVGAQHTLDVATPQTAAGKSWLFNAWSDGGTRVHDVVLPATPVTYTATFAASPTAVPVASYGFEETTGLTTNDASGNARTGTLSGGTVRTAAGKFGRALTFDGINDSVTVPHNVALGGSAGYTVEAWVRPTSTATSQTVVAKERYTSTGYALYSRAGGTLPKALARAKVYGEAVSPAALPLNTWSHLAVTWDGTTMRLYVNGVLKSSTPLTGTILANPGFLRIGGNRFAAEYFAGQIDEVRIYDQAISAAQVAGDMTTPVGP